MTLKDYLAQDGKSATDLAIRAGVSISTISRAARGKVVPHKLISRISELTDGAVTPNDFFEMAA